MISTYCNHCDTHHLLTNRHLISTHRTSEGLIGYLRCPAGNGTIIHRFPRLAPPPRPAWADQFDPRAAIRATSATA